MDLNKFAISTASVTKGENSWSSVAASLKQYSVTEDSGTKLIEFREALSADHTEGEKWAGVLETPTYYDANINLETSVYSEAWSARAADCLGFYTFSKQQKEVLKSLGIKKPICVLPYLYKNNSERFELTTFMEKKQVLVVGDDMKNINQLREMCPGLNFQAITENQSEEIYFDLLKSSIVVLGHNEDLRALSLIRDCVALNVPILVPFNSGFKSELDPQYPLFYFSNEDIVRILDDKGYLEIGYEHLIQIRSGKSGSSKELATAIRRSALYYELPHADPRYLVLPTYELSVVFCVTRAVTPDSFKRLVNSYITQDFDQNFELIVWNSNPEIAPIITRMIEEYHGIDHIKFMQCNEFFGQNPINALANLVRSSIMMIIDEPIVIKSHGFQSLYSSFSEATVEAMFFQLSHDPICQNQVGMVHTSSLKKVLVTMNNHEIVNEKFCTLLQTTLSEQFDEKIDFVNMEESYLSEPVIDEVAV